MTTLVKQENQQVESFADHYVDVGDYGLSNMPIVKTSQGFQIYDLDANTAIGKLPIDFCEDPYNSECSLSQVLSVGNNELLLMSTSGVSFVYNPADGSITNAQTALQMPENINYLMQLHDGSLIEVTSGDHVWYTDIASKTSHEILNPDQWEKLTGSFGTPIIKVNPVSKTLYVQTTDEQIIIDTDGEQVGEYSHLTPTFSVTDDEFSTNSAWIGSSRQRVDMTKLGGVAWIYNDDQGNYGKENGVGINTYDADATLAPADSSKIKDAEE